MASINVRKDTGKLYLDFRYRNIRCREQTDLTDTKANRAKLSALLSRVEAEILLGTFDYATVFPNSRMLSKIERVNGMLNGAAGIPTFGEFAKKWFNDYSPQWRDSYLKTVSTVLNNRLIPALGDRQLQDITKAELLDFRAQLANTKKKNGDPLSPSHINRHLKILRNIMLEASERFGFECPYRGIKLLNIPKSDIHPFNPTEINLILSSVRADFREYFTVRFCTGLRTGEIDGLKWKYVDFDNRLIYVRETVVNGLTEYTKNDYSQRDVQMNQPCFDALMAMKARTAAKEYVFCNTRGNPLEHNNVTKRVWYPLLRSLNLKKRNPYQIRHTTATLWLASGEAPEWIASQMGHSNTEMLFRVYSRFVPNLTRKDGSAAEKLFAGMLTSH